MSGRFALVLELGNAAMQAPVDVAAALRRIAVDLEECGGSRWHRDTGRILDRNGNTCGSWQLQDVDQD